MNFFRIYVYILISFLLFSCDIFSTPNPPKDAEEAFQDIIKNLKLSQLHSECSFFDARTVNSKGTTESSRSYEMERKQEYNDFLLNNGDISESLKEKIIEKKTVTHSQSGSYKVKIIFNEAAILYKYHNYGLNLIGITGVMLGTEVDKSNGSMNIEGLLKVSGLYNAVIEIRNLRINNKNDKSYCAKVESLENKSDSKKWSIYIKYEHPKTKQEMSLEFNESNKEQNRSLLESLLQQKNIRENLLNTDL